MSLILLQEENVLQNMIVELLGNLLLPDGLFFLECYWNDIELKVKGKQFSNWKILSMNIKKVINQN